MQGNEEEKVLDDRLSEVKEAHRKEREDWKRERLLCVKMRLEQKHGIRELASLLGRSPTTVNNWLQKWKGGGIEGLLERKEKGRGPKPALDGEQMEEFKTELEKGKWRTGGQARKWVRETFDIEILGNNIYNYLGKLGAKLKVPRPCHRKRDQEKGVKFQASLTQKLLDLELPKGRPVRLWIYDEMRYGLAPITRRMWTTKGTELIATEHKRYQWSYLYGAFQVGGAGAEFLHSPHVNKEADLHFLAQISERDPYAQHVIIGDGAGFHHKEGQERPEGFPDNVHIITLPPYSPELNPMEQVWDIIKDGICNKVYQTLDDIEKAIDGEIKHFWDDVKKVFSLIGDGFLLSKLNASSNYARYSLTR